MTQPEVEALIAEWDRAATMRHGSMREAVLAEVGNGLRNALTFFKRAAPVGRNAERQDPQGLGPKDEHAVPEGQAPKGQQP